MLAKLFHRLTDPLERDGHLAFDAITRVARRPDWYRDGRVPDTIDGRFELLATVTALVIVRLEALGQSGERLSAALTGRFAEVMESEHRELGIGDATLGKTVLKLVGLLARRVDLWRSALESDPNWSETGSRSLPPNADAQWCGENLRDLWVRLEGMDVEAIAEGKLR